MHGVLTEQGKCRNPEIRIADLEMRKTAFGTEVKPNGKQKAEEHGSKLETQVCKDLFALGEGALKCFAGTVLSVEGFKRGRTFADFLNWINNYKVNNLRTFNQLKNAPPWFNACRGTWVFVATS